MNWKLLTLAISLLIAGSAAAQKNRRYTGRLNGGLLFGESRDFGQLHLVNGLRTKKWTAGAGAGIDWYYLRSVPVYASASRDLFSKKHSTVSLFGNLGYNLPWVEERMSNGLYQTGDNHRGGLYWSADIGYTYRLGKSRHGLLFSVGYSYKRMSEELSYVYPCLVPPCNPVVERFDYRMRRLSVQLGWIF